MDYEQRILEIIKHCIESRYLHTSTIKGISQKQCFAWLENLKDCEVIRKEWFEHIKKSWYKEGYIDGKYSGAKEWKKSDATILNELIDFLENGKSKLQHDLTLYANWLKKQFTPLEKQGEQKETLCDKCKKAQPSHSCQDITALGRCYIENINTSNKVEPKFKVKYAGSEYNVLKIKEIAGVTYYGIEDEPNHIDYVQAENCEIISVYSIKENGSPYPTKPAAFSEQKSWSEEDEKMLNSFLHKVEVCNLLSNNEYAWAKHFFELGLKAQSKDMIEALHTEYEKGRADVIADTLSWLENCWPKYCSNQTIIEGFKEAIKRE